MQDTFFYRNQLLNCRGRLLDLSRPAVMGILNITPDSFFDGGKFTEQEAIVKQVSKMLSEGASIIDIGPSSSRPGASLLPPEEELKRLLPVLRLLRAEFPDAIWSVDTCYAQTAREAVENGAHIINDISAGQIDPDMFTTMALLQVPYVMMHMQGLPSGMQRNPVYENVTEEVIRFFIGRLEQLRNLNLYDVILDPGFGFGKTLEHNFTLLNRLEDFKIFGLPILAGLSRKSMVCRVLDVRPEQALNGTTALHVLALQRGASLLRAHDVKEAMEAIRLVGFAAQNGSAADT